MNQRAHLEVTNGMGGLSGMPDMARLGHAMPSPTRAAADPLQYNRLVTTV